MRHVIWGIDDYFEQKNVAGGYTHVQMDAFGVEFTSEVPLLARFNTQEPPRGRVFNIEFAEGEITGEVEFFGYPEQGNDLLHYGDVILGGYYKMIKFNHDKTVVLACDLVGVSMVLPSEIPMRRRRDVKTR